MKGSTDSLASKRELHWEGAGIKSIECLLTYYWGLDSDSNSEEIFAKRGMQCDAGSREDFSSSNLM